jgi:hypothetical protein
MKLLMENWRQYLTEEEMRTQIITYLEENNIVLTESELEEAMPRWMKKLGTGAALAATLGAGGPAQADAFDDMDAAMAGFGADAPAEQAQETSSKLPADADAAKASLADIAAELEGVSDPFEEMDILNDYGLVDQSSSEGKTTLSFKTSTGGGVTIQVPTSQVPAQLIR